jgi:hypothetical protein
MFHNIEQLNKDSQGYVYWKGNRVEHYSFSYDGEGKEREATAAKELADRCLFIESLGLEATAGNIANPFEEMSDQWFADNFRRACNASDNIKAAAVEICRKFAINGLCDAPYIANVVAGEIDRGKANLQEIANRLAVYPSIKTQEEINQVRSILASHGIRGGEDE